MVLVDTYGLGIGINGKRVDLHEVTKEQLQADLPPPPSYRSLHSRPTCAPRLNKLPEPVPTIPVWLERTFFETLEFNKGLVVALGVYHFAPGIAYSRLTRGLASCRSDPRERDRR